MGLMPYEKETSIVMNEEELVAYVYTCDRNLMRVMEAKGIRAIREHSLGGRVVAKHYVIDKNWVVIDLPRKPRGSELVIPEAGIHGE